LTTAYGTTVTATQSPVTGVVNTPVSYTVAGLNPNTTYHYRVVGQNASGTTSGSDMIFSTSATAPAVTTTAATGVTATGATLNGTVNANNQSTTVTFEYGLTTAYGATVTATQSPVTGAVNTPVSYTVAGLNPNATYHYRVVGQNASGTTSRSDIIFSTSATAPAVTTTAATGVTTTGATLNGTVNANNQSTTVTFEYGLTTVYGTTVTATQSPVTGVVNTPVSYTVAGLNPNVTYHYRVMGQNTSGTTSGSDMTFVTGGDAADVETRDISNIASNSAFGGGRVFYDGGVTVTARGVCWSTYPNPDLNDPHTNDGSGTGRFSSSLTGLTEDTTYFVRAYATNAIGTSYGNNVSFTTLEPLPEITITNPIKDSIVDGQISIRAVATGQGDPVEFYIDDILLGNGSMSSLSDKESGLMNVNFDIDKSKYLIIDSENILKKISSNGDIDNVFDKDMRVDDIRVNSIGEIFVTLKNEIVLQGYDNTKYIKIDVVNKTVFPVENLKIRDKKEPVMFKYDELSGNYSIDESAEHGVYKKSGINVLFKEKPVKVIKNTILPVYGIASKTFFSFKDRHINEDSGVFGDFSYTIDWNTLDYLDGLHTIRVDAIDRHSRIFTDEIDVLIRNFKIELDALRKEDSAYTFAVHFAELKFKIDNPKNRPVVKYVIFRRIADGEFEFMAEIKPLNMIDNSYTYYDNNIDKGKIYTYKVVAYDSLENILSESELKTL